MLCKAICLSEIARKMSIVRALKDKNHTDLGEMSNKHSYRLIALHQKSKSLVFLKIY